MKKTLLLLAFMAAFYLSKAQTTVGPKEQMIVDSLCRSMNRIDLTKITTAQQATAAFEDCFAAQSALFVDVAEEKHLNIEDQTAMHNLGIEIGKELLRQKCSSFVKLATLMAKKDKNDAASSYETFGTVKRIDNKGFDYIVIADANKSEKSFLWLRQFPGSDSFISDATKLIGKHVKIVYQEMEVYLPQAKGYYAVKEITALNIQP